MVPWKPELTSVTFLSTFYTLTSNNEHDWSPVKYLNVLHHNRTQKKLQILITPKYFITHVKLCLLYFN